MTASAGTVEGLPLFGVPEGEPDQADEGRSEGDAGQPALVDPAEARRQLHERIHPLSVLAVIAAVQLAWIATLIYGIRLLLP